MAIEQADPGGVNLDEANLVADLVVMVRVEAGLLGVEGLRAVHVRHGDLHQFESPVHGAPIRGHPRAWDADRAMGAIAWACHDPG
jgi:hypothetical protein